MPIKFLCPGCKKGLTAKDEQAGKKVVCPACKKPLVIPRPAPVKQGSATESNGPASVTRAVAEVPPTDVEATAAALLSDGPVEASGPSNSIDFNCEHCDAAVRVPLADAGKNVPCPECRRIIKVRPPVKQDPSNWRRADKHLPSAAKAPDQPAPDGAWGNLTRTVVSREALEEANAIPEKPEPVPLRTRITFWAQIAAGVILIAAATIYGYGSFSASRKRHAIESVLSYAADPNTLKAIGAERVGALHTLAGTYFARARVPYSDSPFSADPGSGERAREQFERALKVLLDADPHSAERDWALGDLAVAMIDLGGDKTDQRDHIAVSWDECLRRIRAAFGAIRSTDTKLDVYRAISARLFERGQADAVQSLASAFGDAAGPKAAARAIGALEALDRGGDKAAASRTCDEILKEFEGKHPPEVSTPVVALAVLLDKKPPVPGKSVDAADSARAGEAEGLARKGQLPQGRALANAAPGRAAKLRAFVAIGSISAKGADDLVNACKIVLESREELASRSHMLLRLVQSGARAGVPDELLAKVADAIADPAVRSRAKLELYRARLKQMQAVAAADMADSVDQQVLSGGLARSDLARHNVRYEKGYLATAASWPDPAGAFGTLGALLGAQTPSE